MRKTFYFYRWNLMVLLLGLFITLTIGIASAQQITVNAQQKQVFEKEMNAYITAHLNEEIAEIKQNTDLIENFDEYTEEDLRNMAKENAKDKYIRHNMKEYLNTYFSHPQAMVTTDTFICDNGGFEDDFLYYKGYTAENYFSGSTTCNPNVNFTPTPVLPVTNRLEIVTSGTDPLVGIQKVKFGNKSLRINNKYGHLIQCNGDWGVDRITKRFKVTKENRNFTVWYALALENPDGHSNRQPFFNIKCDRAIGTNLCFDPDFLDCDQKFYDNECYFDSIDVLDWACHRIKIPKEFIDSIATLEITVGDCGAGGHFGYAYIDGICEECDTNSTLGSIHLDEQIDYASCYGDLATVCGTYTTPKVCGKDWGPFEITVPGYEITNVSIDTATKSFCFDFPRYNFYSTFEECLEIYAKIVFTSGTDSYTPAQYSNSIEICMNLYEEIDYNIVVGECNDNNTEINLSDDYYYVYIDIISTNGEEWTIDRQLEDPYQNEDDTHTIATGTGDASLVLGPFLIQEGDWWLMVSMPSCEHEDFIQAPDYCSGCDKFYEAEIGNVQCDPNNPTTKWQFDIFVPGDPSKQYFLDGPGGGPKSYNVQYTITGLEQDSYCKEYTLVDGNCTSEFTICPPKPCDDDCDLQVEADVECYTDDNGDVYYFVNLDVSGAGQGQHYCYSTIEAPYPPDPNPSGSPLIFNPITGSYIIGSFSTDIYLTVYLCDDGVNCDQNCRDCFKTIYIPKPDCERQKEIERGGKGRKGGGEKGEGITIRKANGHTKLTTKELIAIPNPFSSNEIILKSKLKNTEFNIYNSSGKLIKTGQFKEDEYKLEINISQGLYFIRYTGDNGKHGFVKIIKL